MEHKNLHNDQFMSFRCFGHLHLTWTTLNEHWETDNTEATRTLRFRPVPELGGGEVAIQL